MLSVYAKLSSHVVLSEREIVAVNMQGTVFTRTEMPTLQFLLGIPCLKQSFDSGSIPYSF